MNIPVALQSKTEILSVYSSIFLSSYRPVSLSRFLFQGGQFYCAAKTTQHKNQRGVGHAYIGVPGGVDFSPSFPGKGKGRAESIGWHGRRREEKITGKDGTGRDRAEWGRVPTCPYPGQSCIERRNVRKREGKQAGRHS
jgi:hypothetical protein